MYKCVSYSRWTGTRIIDGPLNGNAEKLIPFLWSWLLVLSEIEFDKLSNGGGGAEVQFLGAN